ncbi:MAG: LPS-assembly protein LptD [Gammaproteobacteria bacterium]
MSIRTRAANGIALNPLRFSRASIFTGLLLCSACVAAQGDTKLCPASTGVPARPPIDVQLEPGDVYVNSDEADIREQGMSHLRGNVEISRDSQQLRADEVFYEQQTNKAELRGNVNFWDESLYLHGDNADVDLEEGTGSFSNADYYLYENRGRGHTDELFIDAEQITTGKNMDFTTCEPEAEGPDFTSNVWKIAAKELRLNHETERGSGKHIVLKVKDVPVFYSPYLNFPISDKRQTGLLTPLFGSSSKGGFELHTPFYWNIAGNFDATLTPKLIVDRGVMGQGQFRYLTESMRGYINLEYLVNDDVFQGRDRNMIQFEHDQHLFGNGRLSLNYNRVSDTQYFEDFGSQLSTTSQRYLPRHADFIYNGSNWQLSARVRDYQTVDQNIELTSKPYRQLPQIRFNYNPLSGNKRINLGLRSEAVYFDRNDEPGLPNDVAGLRLDVFPTISYPYRTTAGYFIPTAGVRYTQYSLDERGPFKSGPSRVLPMLSVDSGLFFERDTTWSDNNYLHTLEPRLYYLYIPDEDQSDLPVFDSGLYNISYNTLFRQDRFTGPDRVGDANQITAAVTSRLINRETGGEVGYIRFAQRYYLSDQDVIRQRIDGNGKLVDNGIVDTGSYSPLIAELGATFIENWLFALEFQWEPDDNVTEKLAFRAQYRPADDKVFNLGYRVRRAAPGVIRRNATDIDQADISLYWPLGKQWRVVGRWNYAVSERHSLDTFAGLEYDSCCFAARFVARRFLTNIDGDYSTGFFLQFELKGLGGLGQRTTSFLEQSIPGYKNGF